MLRRDKKSIVGCFFSLRSARGHLGHRLEDENDSSILYERGRVYRLGL
jgi:hypothetical protein